MLYREIIAVCSEIQTKHTMWAERGMCNVKLAVHIVTTGFYRVNKKEGVVYCRTVSCVSTYMFKCVQLPSIMNHITEQGMRAVFFRCVGILAESVLNWCVTVRTEDRTRELLNTIRASAVQVAEHSMTHMRASGDISSYTRLPTCQVTVGIKDD
jgi:hypothetical protein